MLKSDFDKIKKEIVANKEIAEKVAELGGISTKVIPSDKEGFNLEQIYVGDVLVKSNYVKQ